ncbi:Os04g0590500 [Oryza sativa Japonica Group]|uniref:Os04g0590500 protein n=1 Tax=Oryza sativa subsp. japonica TaxID=39947 RepID=A0A0P0WE59_ORYSJ|nr:Os04g0590500 [Oryza sativa Japonica Group]
MKQHCHDEHVRVVVRPRCAVLAVHLVDLLAVVAGVGAPPAEQHEVVEDLGVLVQAHDGEERVEVLDHLVDHLRPLLPLLVVGMVESSMPVMSMNSSSSPAATNTNQMIMAKFLGFLHQLTGGADDGSSMVDMLLRTWCDADGGDGGVERRRASTANPGDMLLRRRLQILATTRRRCWQRRRPPPPSRCGKSYRSSQGRRRDSRAHSPGRRSPSRRCG